MTREQAWSGPERRRHVRVAAHEAARYLIADHCDRGWGTCRVIDRSPAGAALLLVGPPWPRYRSEWRLRVEFDDAANGHWERVGFVRNTTLTEDGRIRIGVEFVSESVGFGLVRSSL
jgi:hypothetical protein